MNHAPINSLKPHPQNNLIYGDSFDDDLYQSIKKHGITSPVIVTLDFTIISGHRRWNVCKALKHEVIPVQEIEETDPDKLVEILIASNVQREKTKEQKAREVKVLKAIEDKRAADRQAAAGAKNLEVHKTGKPLVVENLPPLSEGKSRDIAAAKVGWSGKTAEKAIAVVDAIDSLKQSDPEKAKELKKDLNKSVAGAYKKINVEPKKEDIKRASSAMQFSTMAISQLERIRSDDPQRREAFERVVAWINNHIERIVS